MLDKLKQNWFVVLVAVILVGACGYYAYDQNKENFQENHHGRGYAS